MLTPRILHHHSRRRWPVRTAARPTTLTAVGASARAVLILTLAALGLISVTDSRSIPWSSVVITLLLALLALAFFGAAQHSHEQRFGRLLSASVATGLAIADFYNLITTAPAASVAVLITFTAILLLVVCSRTHQHPRR